MNAVARAHLTYQMLALLQKYLYLQSQYSTTWDSKCQALIAQIGRVFCVNPKVEGSGLLEVETSSLSKTSAPFTKASVRESKMNAVAHAQLTFQMLTLSQKYLMAYLIFFGFDFIDNLSRDAFNHNFLGAVVGTRVFVRLPRYLSNDRAKVNLSHWGPFY